MILIRGVKGHKYAKAIDQGKIACRDLLSTVTSPETSSYVYAGYFEKYFMTAFKQLYRLQDVDSKLSVAIQMALSDFVPEMYLTYLHILNDNSEEWLNSSFASDDYEFFYYIPILDEVTGELIHRDYTGQRMHYVDSISSETEEQNKFISHWPLTLLNGKNVEIAYLSSVITRAYNALLYPLFQRVRDEKFGDIENEFRIVKFNYPIKVDQYGNISYDSPRTIKTRVDSDLYYGVVVKPLHSPYPMEKRDMLLTADNPLLVKRNEWLSDLCLQGKHISFASQFSDIDIRKTASSYGYIGDKKACLRFIKEARQNKYYSTNDVTHVIRYRYIDLEKQEGYHWNVPQPYVDYNKE